MTLPTRANPDRLYELLPALYREADAQQGFALRALLRLIGGQADLLREDVQQLWDDFFVETCEAWAIPYIGELVGNNLLHDIDRAAAARSAEALFLDLAGPNLRPIAGVRTRADVAKTIYYRRRKGTPPMLEELARDVTGWGSHVVEFFERLTWNQNLNHVRLHSSACPDLRQADAGDRAHGPFDGASHTVDVRRIEPREGWYNLRNIGFFLWRLRSYPMQLSMPRRMDVAGSSSGPRYTFSPLGASAPLFTFPRREADETGMATELHVPAPIRPPAFFEDLRAAKSGGATPEVADYYGRNDDACSFAVYEEGDAGPELVPASQIVCVNLEHWSEAAFQGLAGTNIGIDVRRGRLIVAKGRAERPLRVAWCYGFSGDVGGGPYSRAKWIVQRREATAEMRVGSGPAATHASLDDALNDWIGSQADDTLITILDNATYALGAAASLLSLRGRLVIQARDQTRPCIAPHGGALRIAGPASGGELTLSGLLVEGGIEVEQDIGRLRLLHTTLVPGRSNHDEGGGAPSGASLVVKGATASGALINADFRLEIAFSITGSLRLPEHATGLWLLDSIVDGGAGDAIGVADSPAPPATIERSTVLGASSFIELPLASESIFEGVVGVERRQAGCVRFSYVPPESRTPRRYRCQPALEIEQRQEAIEARANAIGESLAPNWKQALADVVGTWLVPSFTSRRYGDPGYAQLHHAAPIQIRGGGEDGAEMGVFNHLKQAQRETNLKIRLEEYLPFGLDAGLLYVT